MNLRLFYITIFCLFYSVNVFSDCDNNLISYPVSPSKLQPYKNLINFLTFPICRDIDELKNNVINIKNVMDKMNDNELVTSGIYAKYNKASEKLEDAFSKCQKELYYACYEKNKGHATSEYLTNKFATLKNNQLLRNKNPGANCFERAYLISKEMADDGINTNIAILNAPVIIARNPFNQNQFHKYEQHAVVIVNLQSHDGLVKKVVIDPQFENGPIDFEAYTTKTTGQKCQEVDSNDTSFSNISCTYILALPYTPFFPSGGTLHTPDILESESSDVCGWSFYKQATSRLKSPGEDPSISWQKTEKDLLEAIHNNSNQNPSLSIGK